MFVSKIELIKLTSAKTFFPLNFCLSAATHVFLVGLAHVQLSYEY